MTTPDDSPPPPPHDEQEIAARQVALTEYDWGDSHWKGPFLVAMSRMANAAAACRAVGISLSGYHYARRHDARFAEALAEAKEIGVDFLEQIAWMRATRGQEERVVRTKRIRDPETGRLVIQEELVLETTRYDNSLLMRLLVANRPEKWRQDLDEPDDEPVRVDTSRRRPDRATALEIARIARELEPPDIEGTVNRD